MENERRQKSIQNTWQPRIVWHGREQVKTDIIGQPAGEAAESGWLRDVPRDAGDMAMGCGRAKRRRTSARVEHVFGYCEQSLRGMYSRAVGFARNAARNILTNLVYNVCRYEQAERPGMNWQFNALTYNILPPPPPKKKLWNEWKINRKTIYLPHRYLWILAKGLHKIQRVGMKMLKIEVP